MLNFLSPTKDDIPSLIAVVLWWLLMVTIRRSPYIVALVSIGGTALHEACHWIFGLLLGAKPGSISLWPRKENNEWILGTASFNNLHLLNAAPVAFAPLAMLPLGVGIFKYWLTVAYLDANYAAWVVASYFTACCFFACVPSSTDVRVGAVSAMLYLIIGYAVWYWGC